MRLDSFLYKNQFFESREKAKKAIESGRIRINDKIIDRPSYDISDDDEVFVIPSEYVEYVGRGGIKLECALDTFGINPEGMRAIDIGASTGGFTDCLLKRGVSRVYAVDIGHGQLHKSLLEDERVINLEGVNARYLSPDIVEGIPVSIAVSDLSFISQKLVIPAVKNVLSVSGIYILLIKPQFEVGREFINKNGIVKSEKARLKAVEDIISFAEGEGFVNTGLIKSPIEGGSGNIEYLASFVFKGN